MDDRSEHNLPRGAQRYDVLRAATEAAKDDEYEDYYTATTIVRKRKGVPMDTESEFLYKLIFKPAEPGLRLSLQETQILLAYYGEMLKEIQVEHERILEEEKAKQQKEDAPCK